MKNCTKKLLSGILSALSVMLFTSGCASQMEENSLSNTVQSKIVEVVPSGAGGTDTEVKSDLSVETTTELPESMPVYTNPFPTDQGGPLYTVTDEDKEKMALDLSTFLGVLFGDPSQSFDIQIEDTESYKALYKDDDLEVYSWESIMRVFTQSHDVVSDAENDNLLNNKLVGAAMQYIEISDPVINDNTLYKANGEVYRYIYKVTDAAPDISGKMYNDAFHYVSVMYFPDNPEVMIEICNLDVAKQEDKAAVAFEDAMGYIQEKYPDEMSGTITCEAYYDPTIMSGYYIPVSNS